MNQGGREGGREGTNKFREAGHALCRRINQLGINKIRSLESRISGKAAYQCHCLMDTNRSIPVEQLGKFPVPFLAQSEGSGVQTKPLGLFHDFLKPKVS